MPGTTVVGLLSAALLSVLTTGVLGALHLEASAAPTAQAQVVPQTAVSPVVVPAWQVAPVPVAPPAPGPAPAPPAPAAAAPAPPADPSCQGDGWQSRRGQAALASLRRPSDAAAFSVRFSGAREGLIGLAKVHERRLEVFVRSCGSLSEALLRHVVAHELGHLVDATRLSDANRAAWKAARGIAAGTPWYGCNECTDFATPAGDFAEVYAQWQRGASSNRAELAGAPSAAELEQLAVRFWN